LTSTTRPDARETAAAALEAVRSRILKLEDQRVALDEALGELREVESQANAALSSLESASRRAAPPMKPVSNRPRRPGHALENQD